VIADLEPLTGRVRHLAARVFELPVSDIDDDCAYKSIAEWDSVGHMDLLAALEAEFGFQLQPSQIAQLTSIQRIADFLASRE
jgi:acyl carrier protein